MGEAAETGNGLTDVATTWATGLVGVTGEQMAAGLHACINREDAWPPTLPEFRTMCLGVRANTENAGAYRQYAALPKPPADKSKALSQFAAMREKLG